MTLTSTESVVGENEVFSGSSAGSGAIQLDRELQVLVVLYRVKWYNRSMKVKTSVTLSEELLAAIDQQTLTKNRSVLIEEATWNYLRSRRRKEREKRELERINKNVDVLNNEALDVIDFQDIE